MKIKLLLLIMLLTINNIFSNIIFVQNPGNGADIQPFGQAAANMALNGDVVIFPAGRFVVNKTIIFSKFISIRAPRAGQTTLVRSESASDNQVNGWGAMIRYNINSQISSKIIISNINFAGKKPSLKEGDGLSKADDVGVEMIRCVDFRITGCKFEFFTNGGVSVTHDDNVASGLIDHNIFIHNTNGYDEGLGYGVVVYGTDKEWVKSPKFGSSNFIFIEDNYFEYHRHSVTGGGAALYVFRHNKVINNVAGNTNHAIDAHEARLDGIGSGNNFSTRAVEVYDNILINTLFRDGTPRTPDGTPIVKGKPSDWLTEAAICTRGGEALIHDNYIEGYRFGVAIVANNEFSGDYPIPYQQGYASALLYGSSGTGENNLDGDVFSWSNTYIPYGNSSQFVAFYNYSPNYLVNERDYHLYAKPNYENYIYPHPLNK